MHHEIKFCIMDDKLLKTELVLPLFINTNVSLDMESSPYTDSAQDMEFLNGSQLWTVEDWLESFWFRPNTL